MDATFFITSEEAIWSFSKNHKRYLMYPHRIKADEEFEIHHHKSANEWLCISRGKFIINVDGEKKYFDMSGASSCLCVCLPKGAKHTLRALTDLKYLVFRDGYRPGSLRPKGEKTWPEKKPQS